MGGGGGGGGGGVSRAGHAPSAAVDRKLPLTVRSVPATIDSRRPLGSVSCPTGCRKNVSLKHHMVVARQRPRQQVEQLRVIVHHQHAHAGSVPRRTTRASAGAGRPFGSRSGVHTRVSRVTDVAMTLGPHRPQQRLAGAAEASSCSTRRAAPTLLQVATLAAVGCSVGHAEPRAPERGHIPHELGDAVERDPQNVVFEGTCDASGAVPIDARHFAVADDENNVLRIYDAQRGGPPLHADDVSPELLLRAKGRKRNYPEADLEAATRVGDTALWLSSHARSKSGKEAPARLRYFATRLPRVGEPIQVRHRFYDGLLQDLLADPRLASVALANAAARAPQAKNGLNIEGMTAMPDGRVLLGFRNPVPDGLALLVTLDNPLGPFHGERARFGEPVRLDLGGMGVRGLSFWRGRYLIAAGRHDGGGHSRLYAWTGPGSRPSELSGAVPPDLNPEAFFTPEERDRIMLLSDDGTRMVDGTPCKKLDDPRRKSFRGVWLRLDAARHSALPGRTHPGACLPATAHCYERSQRGSGRGHGVGHGGER